MWIEVLLGLAVAVAVLGRGGDGAAPSLVFLIGGAAAAYSAFVVYRAAVALTDDRLPTSAGVQDRREALEYEKNLALARDQNPLTKLPGNNMPTRATVVAEREGYVTARRAVFLPTSGQQLLVLLQELAGRR